MKRKSNRFKMGRRIPLLTTAQRRKLPSVLRFVERMEDAIASHSPKELKDLADCFLEMCQTRRASERRGIAYSVAELLLSKADHAIFCGDAYEL